MKKSSRKRQLQVIGWREWVSLPELGIKQIKAKIDTGARSSAIHAFGIDVYRRLNSQYVEFKIHPEQRNTQKTTVCRAKIKEFRRVKSSNGQSELRPVITTTLRLLGQEWPIEVSLANRDEMGFRMLLGRESLRNRLLVDPGRSFYGDKPKKSKKK